MSQTSINPEVWGILKDDEKTSLSLALGHNKSSWEAGEIMKKAHYKYLEIQSRAEKFLRMFTEYYEVYGKLIPKEVNIPVHFEEYLGCVILKRMTIKDAVFYLEDGRYKVTSSRERLIEETFRPLLDKNRPAYKDFTDLILEFDRWNNFRILPHSLQQPSAFKRRNKSRELKHLKNLQGLPDFSIVKLIEKYEVTKNVRVLYVPLLTTYFDSAYYIMKVDHQAKVVNQLSSLGLFIFSKMEDAEIFADLIHNYTIRKKSRDNNKVMNGQRFWPEFRVQLKKSLNYEIINNLIPNRRFFEDAYFNLELFSGKRVKL